MLIIALGLPSVKPRSQITCYKYLSAYVREQRSFYHLRPSTVRVSHRPNQSRRRDEPWAVAPRPSSS